MKCRMCSGERTKKIKKIKEYHLVKCIDCGIIYINPFPNLTKNHELYEKDYLNNSKYYDLNREDDLVSFGKRIEQLEKIIGKTKNSLLLDYGCSTGNFLEAALEHGYQAEGIELNQNSVTICRKKKLRVNEPLKKEYGLIHAGDIIEHLQEPSIFVQELNSLLKNNGTLILSTPDFDKWITRITQVKPEEHLFYFTKKTLKEVLEKSGFKVIYLHNCSRKRSISSLLLSSTSQNKIISTILKILNSLYLSKVINWAVSNLNDDILAIAQKPDSLVSPSNIIKTT